MEKHLYILPNGFTASNMKDGCEILGIQSEAFRRRVRAGIILKTVVESFKCKGDYEGIIQK